MTPPHGIYRNPLKFFVFAGNYREYRQWLEEKGVSPQESMFVANPENLLGYKESEDDKATFIIVGTFHMRPDAQKIMTAARERWPTAAFYRA